MPSLQPSDTDHLAPWIVDIAGYMQPHAQTNFNTLAIATAYPLNCYRYNSGVQFASVTYIVALSQGSWSLYVTSAKSSSWGIATVSIDGVDVGTIDFYSASNVWGNWGPANFTVVNGGPKTVKMRMDTKNGSSSGYELAYDMLRFLRTA